MTISAASDRFTVNTGPRAVNPPAQGAVYMASPLSQQGSQEDAVAASLQSLKKPTSIVLIAVTAVALMCAGLLGGELYLRQKAQSIITAMAQCIVDDDANVSIATPPPLLLQTLTGHYAGITIATAGKQVRSAKGMRVVLDIVDLHVPVNGSSGITVGSLSATIVWTDDGMKRTAQQAIPLFGASITAVGTDPSTGTIALHGVLGSVIAKPAVADGSLRLQVESFTGLGFPLPPDGLQWALDSFAAEMKTRLPTGLRVDGVRVTDTGVAAHFSARNVSIPAPAAQTCSGGQRWSTAGGDSR